MKIINPGNDTTTYRFHCKCGCVYEAAEWELQCSDEHAFPRFQYTRCPRCGNMIPTYEADIVDSTDTLAENISEDDAKSESAENCCENCYEKCVLSTRDSSSKFGTTPDKSSSTNIIEQSELTKLRVSVKFLQNYCERHNCKGCPFDEGIYEGCGLVQEPKFWNTDL